MFSRFTLFFAALLAGLSVQTVSAQLLNHNHAACGTSGADQELIKERLFENRRNKAALMAEYETFKQSRSSGDTTLWVPVVFHMASRADGTGQHKDDWVLQEMCYFNQNFADQNMKFYLVDINRFNSDQIYVNDGSADYIRSIHRRSGAMNIFVGGPTQPSSGYGAYYAPNFDWIFTWKDIYNWGLTHEVGHLFTLAHTFNGWEGTDYSTESAGSGKAPEMGTNGKPVEKVARGTNDENCQWAADGFCDTNPDFSSGGGSCSSGANQVWYDPDSVAFQADNSVIYNYMSYFFCTPKVFSNDQKEAMLLDNISRGHHLTDVPYPVEVVDGVQPTTIWPNTGDLAPYTSAPVHFRWNAVDSANMYLIKVDQTFNNGSVVVQNTYTRVAFSNEAWLDLAPNTEYTWTVEPMTRHDVCRNIQNASAPQTFNTADWAVGTLNAIDIESSRIFPNPTSSSNEVILEIKAAAATDVQISIINSLGQKILPSQTINVNAGTHLEMLNIQSLASGMYIVNIETAKERISHKLVVQD